MVEAIYHTIAVNTVRYTYSVQQLYHIIQRPVRLSDSFAMDRWGPTLRFLLYVFQVLYHNLSNETQNSIINGLGLVMNIIQSKVNCFTWVISVIHYNLNGNIIILNKIVF